MDQQSTDGEWLRAFVRAQRDVGRLPENWEKQLEGIALGCDELAIIRQREAKGVTLEAEVDEILCGLVEAWRDQQGRRLGDSATLAAALWLLGKQTKAAATVSSLASAFGPLIGAVALGGGSKGGFGGDFGGEG